MRNYTEKQAMNWWIKPVKMLTAIILPVILMFLLALIFSALIANTSIPESSESFIMVAISAITSLTLAVLLVLASDSKGIVCALISFAVMFLLKFLATEIVAKTVHFGKQGIISILFTALFCFAGSIIGSNLKK